MANIHGAAGLFTNHAGHNSWGHKSARRRAAAALVKGVNGPRDDPDDGPWVLNLVSADVGKTATEQYNQPVESASI